MQDQIDEMRRFLESELNEKSYVAKNFADAISIMNKIAKRRINGDSGYSDKTQREDILAVVKFLTSEDHKLKNKIRSDNKPPKECFRKK